MRSSILGLPALVSLIAHAGRVKAMGVAEAAARFWKWSGRFIPSSKPIVTLCADQLA